VALHACASGILTAEAAVSLLSNCGGWLHRDDFTSQFITTADDDGHGAILMAAIDWQATVTALDHGLLPCSSGNGTCSNWPPASPPESPSASATP
jgi:hypothetical protein